MTQDPEQRAFTGGADMPPQQPDQPADQNKELLREDGEAPEGGAASADEGTSENPHGEYTDLPGYGG